MEESERKELIAGIANDIASLTSKLDSEWQSDLKLSLDIVHEYWNAFRDEGLSYLGNKTSNLTGKFMFENPNAKGLQEIKDFIAEVELPLSLKQTNSPDKKAHLNSYVESEKKKIAEFENRSSLEKINDHFDKNATVESNGTLRVTGLTELNRELNKGKPFIGNILEFALTHDRLPTDAEIADMPKQGETPPLERRNFNIKEKNMSDQFEELEEKNLDPKELAFRRAAYERKVIADAVKAGTLCCLPGADGYADTKPAYNVFKPETSYHGMNLLYLKDFQQKNGFPTEKFITYEQIENAQKDIPELSIRKGQKGISLHVNEKDKETKKWEEKHIRLFNVAQVSNPEKLINWVEKKLDESNQKDIEWQKRNFGSNYEPPERKQKEPGPEIVCSSTEPEKYLGQYLAAVSMHSKFKVSPEQAAEFSEKMINALYKPLEPKINKETGEVTPPPISKTTGEVVTDVFSIDKISIKANEECRNFMKDLRIEKQNQNQPEQKQKQTQSLGRGM